MAWKHGGCSKQPCVLKGKVIFLVYLVELYDGFVLKKGISHRGPGLLAPFIKKVADELE